MAKSPKSRAEMLFAESDKKSKEALNKKEKARRASAEHTAKLRALRLAKEATDKASANDK